MMQPNLSFGIMVTFKMDASKAMAELMLSNCFEKGLVLDRQTDLNFLVPKKWSRFLALGETRNPQVKQSC